MAELPTAPTIPNNPNQRSSLSNLCPPAFFAFPNLTRASHKTIPNNPNQRSSVESGSSLSGPSGSSFTRVTSIKSPERILTHKSHISQVSRRRPYSPESHQPSLLKASSLTKVTSENSANDHRQI